MRFLEEYFPEFAEAMDEVDAVSEMRRAVDDRTYHLICLAMAVGSRSPVSLRAHFHGAVACGVSLKEIASVIAIAEREASRMDDTWIHDALGDWTQLTRDDFDSGCRCGVPRRY